MDRRAESTRTDPVERSKLAAGDRRLQCGDHLGRGRVPIAASAALDVDAAPLATNLEEDVRLDRATRTRLREVLDTKVHPATLSAQVAEGTAAFGGRPWSLHQARGHDQLGSDRVAAGPVAQVRQKACRSGT